MFCVRVSGMGGYIVDVRFGVEGGVDRSGGGHAESRRAVDIRLASTNDSLP